MWSLAHERCTRCLLHTHVELCTHDVHRSEVSGCSLATNSMIVHVPSYHTTPPPPPLTNKNCVLLAFIFNDCSQRQQLSSQRQRAIPNAVHCSSRSSTTPSQTSKGLATEPWCRQSSGCFLHMFSSRCLLRSVEYHHRLCLSVLRTRLIHCAHHRLHRQHVTLLRHVNNKTMSHSTTITFILFARRQSTFHITRMSM